MLTDKYFRETINNEDLVEDDAGHITGVIPPDYLRRIAQTKSPAKEWSVLERDYADLIPYLIKGDNIPIEMVRSSEEESLATA